MIYRYKGIDATGQKVNDKIEASSLAEAKAKLKNQKILYSSIKEERASIFDHLSLKRTYKISPKDLSNLSRELATYIRSGISIVQALRVVQNHYTNNKRLSLFLSEVNRLLDEGKNFYAALNEQKVLLLPEFYKQSIKVSEDGGILDEVLLELADFLKEQEKLRKEIKSAFAYPGFMIAVSLIMIAFMLTFVVPQITSIFASMHQELPTPTKVVIALADFFTHNYMILLVFIAIFVALFMLLRQKSEKFAYWVDRLLLKIPFFGSLIERSELARFAYMASLLVRSGVPFVQTINLSANILNNRVIKQLFLDASKDVVEGKTLSSSLLKANYKIDYAFVQTIALGEETSQIEAVLSNISELYFEENRDKTSMLLSLLEPALMLFVGGSIGFIVAAMLLPIFSMSIQ
ncbi:Type IV fimbrial assembly protein PilC [hydrothermal vent metagenome]|uniref:Type IV fimbrial assembly protein PilC n=1 Tax=hydrothermal vent metagenome TaxID=652676 RepID=A0A1W1BKE3_9ZZZZ